MAWQGMIKSSILLSRLQVPPQIFYCSSFISASLSSFQWTASPWAAAKTYIFPANNVSPLVPGLFSHLTKFVSGGDTISQHALNGDRHDVDFSTLCGQTSSAWLVFFRKASLAGEMNFPPLLDRDHLACKFCLFFKNAWETKFLFLKSETTIPCLPISLRGD